MSPGLWAFLGYLAGSLATLLALQPVLAERYRSGRTVGYAAAYDDLEPRIAAAHARGRAEGKSEGFSIMAEGIVRDMGAEGARAFAARLQAMDRVAELTGGKRT